MIHAEKNSKYFSLESFSQITHICFIIYAFVSALSIGVSQTLVIFSVLYWMLLLAYYLKKSNLNKDKQVDEELQFFFPLQSRLSYLVVLSLVLWLVCCYVAIIVGVSFSIALAETLKTTLYLLLSFAVYTSLKFSAYKGEKIVRKISWYLFFFACGQFLAAIHTILSNAIGRDLPPSIVGAVTESGQLVLIIPIILSLLFLREEYRKPGKLGTFTKSIFGLVFFLCLFIFSWPDLFYSFFPSIESIKLQYTAGFLVLLIAICFAYKARVAHSECPDTKWYLSTNTLLYIGLTLLVALVLNLKRGPWLAVFFEFLIVGFFLSPRFLFSTLGITAASFIFLSPVRTRALDFVSHFFIVGGRKDMWHIGIELAERYPLGLGLDNARYMQVIDPSLPETHRHMHSNLLNIAVETGLMGVLIFTLWSVFIIALGFSAWKIAKKNMF